MTTKTLFISIIGRPNVGKSTLQNAIIGEKVSIVSPKPQTTRFRVNGIMERGDVQYVFIDTPGMHKPKNKLGEKMVNDVKDVLGEADVSILVTDKKLLGEIELDLLLRLKSAKIPFYIIINKIDKYDKKEELLPAIEKCINILSEHDLSAEGIIPMCAVKNDGVNELVDLLKKHAVPDPWQYPEGIASDQSDDIFVCESIREKLLYALHEEIPHGINISIIQKDIESSGRIAYEINIICEKDSHKGMIIGKDGAVLKQVKEKAKKEIEKRLKQKVTLNLWVVVKNNWRNDIKYI